MSPEDIINLFDSYWFNYEIFKKNQSFLLSKTNPSSTEPKYSSLRSILVRSQSDDVSSFNYGSFSPKSVLFNSETKQQQQEPEPEAEKLQKKQSNLQEKKKNKKKKSKSLSDLEFEELKGFMDLGFVFSEKDKDSSLIEIIPGLQRLGENDDEEITIDDEMEERRPYLSEAWKDFNGKIKKKENKSPLMMKWKVPDLSDEIDMKDNLKLWAHTVASYVR